MWNFIAGHESTALLAATRCSWENNKLSVVAAFSLTTVGDIVSGSRTPPSHGDFCPHKDKTYVYNQ